MTIGKPNEESGSQPWKDRVALVTGAGRGIGRAIALGLAADGARVALLARSQGELDEVAKSVHDQGGLALVVRADVGDPDQAERAAAHTLAELGTVDILVNNAAVVWPLAPTTTVDPAEWAAAIAINVVGPFILTSALLPAMIDHGWGRIVNVSSAIAARPAFMIGGNAYATSKAALEAHTLNLSAELTGTGVTVNVFRPGSVDTAMQGWIRSQSPDRIGLALHQSFTRSYEEGSLLTPEQSARSLLAHLASDATGEIWTGTDA
ncbi:MAG: SDR family oxidoreductase [Acidimicrobiales bacterium]|jgi:3-oxoacyl-[acyl-carrier protein] reductase